MVYIVEAFVEDYLHVLANVNLIKIFKNIYPDQSFIFISPQKHNDQVKKYLDGQYDYLAFETVKNLSSSNSFFAKIRRTFSRIHRDIKLLYYVFKKCKSEDLIVITHIHFFSLVLLKLIKKRYPKITVFLIIHGDVEYVFFSKTIREKIVGFFHKLMFKIKSQKTFYVFLTPISKKVLIRSQRISDNEVFAIELPTFPNHNKFKNNKISSRKTIKIGHIGSAGIRKNVQLFYRLASDVKDLIAENIIEFSNVGVLEKSIGPFLNPLILNYVNGELNTPLLRDVYDEKISNLHYSIFFYGQNDFILRSSAAFFDAIFYEKPIIALRNTFFEDIFEREGEIGYLCANLEEMRLLIIELSKKEEFDRKYLTLVENIKVYKLKLTTEGIASVLKKDIESKLI